MSSESAPRADAEVLDDLRAFAVAGAAAIEDLAEVLDALRSRVAGFAGPHDPDGSGRFDVDAIWGLVERHLDARDPGEQL